MLLAAVPTKIDIIWARDAGPTYVRAVPDPVQQPSHPYDASWTVGFPPDTFLAPGAGGAGPDGRDVNGAIQQISAWAQWQAAGGPIVYDATFQTNIGGYPNRALVASATTPGEYWISTADNNITNPDTGGAGWVNFFASLTGGNNSWSGANAFSGAVSFTSTVSLGSQATATTQTVGSNNTFVATTAYADRAANTAAATAQSNAIAASESYSDTQLNAFKSEFAWTAAVSGTLTVGPITIQWGQTSNAAADFTVFFHQSFSGTPWSVTATVAGNAATLIGAFVDSSSTAGFVARIRNASGNVGGQAIDWVAIGPT